MAQFGMSHFICPGFFPVDLLKGRFCRPAAAAHLVAHEKYGFVELIKTISVHSWLPRLLYFDKISWSAAPFKDRFDSQMCVIRFKDNVLFNLSLLFAVSRLVV